MPNPRIFLFLVLLLLIFSACKPREEAVNPEGAKQILQLRGYEISVKGYFKAIEAEDLAAIRTFFQAGIDPNSLNEKGETPLTFAVGCCEAKTIKALLEKVDINGRDKDGNTALFVALRDSKKAKLDVLLEKGADVNAPGKDGKTLLHIAAARDDFKLAKQLIERGANINALDDKNRDTPLIQACIGDVPQTDIIKLFLDKGANVNHQSKDNATCLIYVAAAGHKDLVQELLDRGADPKLKDKDGKSARDWALVENHKDVAELLKVK